MGGQCIPIDIRKQKKIAAGNIAHAFNKSLFNLATQKENRSAIELDTLEEGCHFLCLGFFELVALEDQETVFLDFFCEKVANRRTLLFFVDAHVLVKFGTRAALRVRRLCIVGLRDTLDERALSLFGDEASVPSG